MMLRATFLSVLALIILAQSVRLQQSAPTGVSTRLDRDLRTLGMIAGPSDLAGTLSISASTCAEPLFLTAVRFDGSGSATAQYLMGQPGEARFIYLGFVGERPDPWQIAVRWAAHTVLHVLGLRGSKAPGKVLLVLIPATCPQLGNVDWAALSPWA